MDKDSTEGAVPMGNTSQDLCCGGNQILYEAVDDWIKQRLRLQRPRKTFTPEILCLLSGRQKLVLTQVYGSFYEYYEQSPFINISFHFYSC